VRIYLDSCSIQRPLDTLSQTRVRLEAEAVLGILEKVDAGAIELVSSTVLELELARNTLAVRREHGQRVLSRAVDVIIVDGTIEKRALEFTKKGLSVMDAFHLAAADGALLDYFCTCDDKFYQRAKRISDLRIQVVTPLELIEAIER